jgi:predicted restriction endonuclease
MPSRKNWTREQLLVAFMLYCKLPFGKLHSRNPEIIKYAELIGRTPSALAMKLTNIASLDPAITSTGRKGLKGASLSDKKMWGEMQNNWNEFVEESEQVVNGISSSLTETEVGGEEKSYIGKTRLVKTKARVGQHFFRISVLSAYNGKCCITGLSQPGLLVASHIIPWKDDEPNRLNPRNGLALSMLHDKAFDLGMITIDEKMKVAVSHKYFDEEDQFYRSSIKTFEGKLINLPEKFLPDPKFLEFHRENIFENREFS